MSGEDQEVGSIFASENPHRETADRWADLERLATAATPGPWTCKEGSTSYPECDDKDFWAAVLSPAGKSVVTLYERSSLDDRKDYDFDAAFIAAANPAAILELITAARASWVGTNGEAGREQKPVVTELVIEGTGQLSSAALAALSRQAQTGNGEGGA